MIDYIGTFIFGLLIGINAGLVIAMIADRLGERRAKKIMAEIDAEITRKDSGSLIDNGTTIRAIDGSTIRLQ